jgi:hypothetical protein
MSDHFEKSQEANELRKKGNFQAALTIYRELAQDGANPFVAAGLLHCLRKLGFLVEALEYCKDFLPQHKDNDWFRNEVIWTIIQGKLDKFDESAQLGEIISAAEYTLSLNPKDNATKWRLTKFPPPFQN